MTTQQRSFQLSLVLIVSFLGGQAHAQESHLPAGVANDLDNAGAEAVAREATAKREVAESLVAKREASMGRALDKGYRSRLVETVASQSMDELLQLQARGGEGSLVNGPGDSSADLVYTPVTPCRVFDTRYSPAGRLPANTQRDFFVAGDVGFAYQGGNPTGCGIPYGPATSVIINLAAVSPTGGGNLRAWAVADPQPPAPLAAVLNYSPALYALANAVAVPICNLAATYCSLGDLRLQADVSSVDVVGDVLGYFSPSQPKTFIVTATGAPEAAVSTTCSNQGPRVTVYAPFAGKVYLSFTGMWEINHLNGTPDQISLYWSTTGPTSCPSDLASGFPLGFSSVYVPPAYPTTPATPVYQPYQAVFDVGAGTTTTFYVNSRSVLGGGNEYLLSWGLAATFVAN